MSTLFSFIDPKDPFVESGLEGEQLPGPILSVLGSRTFDRAVLFHTPHTQDNAEATFAEVQRRFPKLAVKLHSIPLANPKDYSAVMGELGRRVRSYASTSAEYFVCVSSGTAEMRAAWFLLTASGFLQATLLEIGSPANPLFGAASVREVDLRSSDWDVLRDLVMPQPYFSRRITSAERARDIAPAPEVFTELLVSSAPAAPPQHAGLDQALSALGIHISSAAMRVAAEGLAAAAAADDVPVLITGETGTGKDLFARLTHRLSPRSNRPMVAVNCAAIPKELVESTLFGHAKGAFTGATAARPGKFLEADGGTLFLDEVGDMPLEAQAKLLRVLQNGEVEPVGGKMRRVDVRIIAATNHQLEKKCAEGAFRDDLYYRLNVVQIELPPLRSRREEIPQLALAILEKINQCRAASKRLSREALKRMQAYDWPGNTRELEGAIRRATVMCAQPVIGPEDIVLGKGNTGSDPFAALPEPAKGFSLERFLTTARRQLIIRALTIANNNQSAAADLLGISKQAVSKFLKGENDNGG